MPIITLVGIHRKGEVLSLAPGGVRYLVLDGDNNNPPFEKVSTVLVTPYDPETGSTITPYSIEFPSRD